MKLKNIIFSIKDLFKKSNAPIKKEDIISDEAINQVRILRQELELLIKAVIQLEYSIPKDKENFIRKTFEEVKLLKKQQFESKKN